MGVINPRRKTSEVPSVPKKRLLQTTLGKGHRYRKEKVLKISCNCLSCRPRPLSFGTIDTLG